MTLKSEAAKAVLFFLLVSPLNILAQDTTPSMRIKTPSCTIQLSVYGDGIVRTQMFQGTEMEERWEPALVAQPKTEGFTFKDGKKEAVLETPKMRVVVNKITSWGVQGRKRSASNRYGCRVQGLPQAGADHAARHFPRQTG